MANKRHWLKHLFSFKREVRLNNNRIREDSTILFESKKRKSIYISSKKLLIEVSTYGKEYLVKLYKFSKKGLKLISQKSCLGKKKLKKVIKFLLLALGITLNQFSNIEAKKIDEYLTFNSQSSNEIHLVMNSNPVMNSITRWPFIIESKNSMISNFEIEHTDKSLSLILSIKGGNNNKNIDHQSLKEARKEIEKALINSDQSLNAQTIRAFKQVIKVLKSEKFETVANVIWEASIMYHKASNAEAQGKTSLRLNIDPRIQSPLQNFEKSIFSEKSLPYLGDDITNHLGKSNSGLKNQATNLETTARQKSLKGKSEIQRHETPRLRTSEDFKKLNFEQAMQLAERSGESPVKIESRQKAGIRSKPEKGKNHGSTAIGVAEAFVSPSPKSPYVQRQEPPLNPFLLKNKGLNTNSLHLAGEKAKEKQNEIVINTPTNLKESSNNSPKSAPILEAKVIAPTEDHHRYFTMEDLNQAFDEAKSVNPNYAKLGSSEREKKMASLITHPNAKNDPNDDLPNNKVSALSVGEAITVLQGEGKGLIKNPKRIDPKTYKSGQQGIDYEAEGPDNVRIVDAKAPTYTGESPEKLKDIAKSNGQKVVRQMDRYSDQDPETLSSLYSAGSEPKPPIGLDQIRTLFNLMRLPDNLKGEYKQNVIDGMKESPIFQNSDPQRQEQFLKNIYFLNDNDNFNNNKDK